ncbi:hypothetical protein BBW65_05860 [Helicobacter enhydrae]|uniref:Uncharacterized protein n=1 Tax=Helicobacter enhydrae TaxID=222136 RepID=A0A1B1U6N9_9HELI|nr:hypothetical protein BBW65_05860 [Helicobacter enhydrae]
MTFKAMPSMIFSALNPTINPNTHNIFFIVFLQISLALSLTSFKLQAQINHFVFCILSPNYNPTPLAKNHNVKVGHLWGFKLRFELGLGFLL